MLEKCNHKHLFSSTAKFYKVNLNCRTNLSDGQYTPAEIKELYKSQGYSAVAFSDRDRLVSHDELTDEGFVALSAFEFTVEEEDGRKISLNAIALDPAIKEFTYEPCGPMTKEEISELIKSYKEKGFFIICNHPRKSGARCGKDTAYEEVDAIEMINYSALTEGVYEYNEITR